MTALLALHALVAAVCLAPGRRWSPRVFLLAAAAPAIGFAWVCWVAPDVLDGTVRAESAAWVPALGLTLQLRLDGWTVLMGALVFGIGALVLGYCTSYFGGSHSPERDDLGRLAGLLVLFAGAMWGLVCADGLATLFLFWELTSLTSFLLIGIDDRRAGARAAAVRAFLVTGAGGLALLGGLLLVGLETGETTLSGLVADPAGGAIVTVGMVLVLVGCLAKSAQFPLHFWLPGAMAAPTPVSAYLHSATMVKAGLVVVARLAPAYAELAPWRPIVVLAGSASMLVGGARALRAQDAKLALAHGTVSQLGLLMVLLGLGTPGATYAGVALLVAHALFKASLFLHIGVVDHAAGTRDLRRLRGIGRRFPAVAAGVVLAAASMAAIPPTFGFVAKESGLHALGHSHVATWGAVALVAVVAGSVLTVAYTLRLVVGVLGDDVEPCDRGEPVDPDALRRPSPAFVAAPGVLAVLGLLGGLLAAPVGEVLAEVAASLDPAAGEGHLSLWAGWNEALALSVLGWALGALVWWVLSPRRRSAPSAVTSDPPAGLAVTVWDRGYDGVLAGARRVTAVTHSGSLPVYLGVVLVALVAALAATLVQGEVTEGSPGTAGGVPIADSPGQLAAVVLTAALTLGALRARRRFGAALMVGGSGFGLALVFLLHGAPDVALTQFLVETLVVVLYLLVLVRLPERFAEPPSWAPTAVRLVLAGAVGVALTAFAIAASEEPTGPSVGPEYVAMSAEEGGGRNVVNVILVDFRGWDTLGEIAVLAIASGGVVNLAAVARREMGRRGLFPSADRRAAGAIAASDTARTRIRRSLVLTGATRGLVPVLVVMSLYLLLRGHDAPGGGFSAGLVTAIAVALRYLADGPDALRRLRVNPVALMGAGLFVAVLVAGAPLLFGEPAMSSSIWTAQLPVFGKAKLVSSFVFDLGVYLVVAGAALGMLRALVATDAEAGEAEVAEPAASVTSPSAASVGEQPR